MSYLKSAISGLYWTACLRVSLRAFSFIRTIVLARLLSPGQFGVYGVAVLTLAFLETLTETGINIFLVQEPDLDGYVHTAWLVSILRGLIISLVIIIFSWPISNFFHSPDARIPILLISVVAFIRGFINPAEVVFQKHLRFNSEFKFRSVLFFIEAVVTVITALITRSTSSFIYGLIAGSLCEVVISFWFIKPTPKFIFDSVKLRRILHRGKWVTAAGIFNYLYHNLDNIVVGRILGVNPLGFYNMAYTVSSLPITEAADAFSKVTFPIFVQIHDQPARLLKGFFKSTLALSALVIPFTLLLFFFPQILVILLGDKWLPAIPALRFLSIYGLIRSISGSSSALFLALNKTPYVTLVTLASIVGLGVTIIPFVQTWGIVGASYSAIIGSLASLPLIAYFLIKIFRSSHAPR